MDLQSSHLSMPVDTHCHTILCTYSNVWTSNRLTCQCLQTHTVTLSYVHTAMYGPPIASPVNACRHTLPHYPMYIQQCMDLQSSHLSMPADTNCHIILCTYSNVWTSNHLTCQCLQTQTVTLSYVHTAMYGPPIVSPVNACRHTLSHYPMYIQQCMDLQSSHLSMPVDTLSYVHTAMYGPPIVSPVNACRHTLSHYPTYIQQCMDLQSSHLSMPADTHCHTILCTYSNVWTSNHLTCQCLQTHTVTLSYVHTAMYGPPIISPVNACRHTLSHYPMYIQQCMDLQSPHLSMPADTHCHTILCTYSNVWTSNRLTCQCLQTHTVTLSYVHTAMYGPPIISPVNACRHKLSHYPMYIQQCMDLQSSHLSMPADTHCHTILCTYSNVWTSNRLTCQCLQTHTVTLSYVHTAMYGPPIVSPVNACRHTLSHYPMYIQQCMDLQSSHLSMPADTHCHTILCTYSNVWTSNHLTCQCL